MIHEHGGVVINSPVLLSFELNISGYVLVVSTRFAWLRFVLLHKTTMQNEYFTWIMANLAFDIICSAFTNYVNKCFETRRSSMAVYYLRVRFLLVKSEPMVKDDHRNCFSRC